MKKYALVTGGTKGIGKAIVLDLLKKDYFVVLTYSSDYISAESLKTEWKEYIGNFEIIKADQNIVKELNDLISVLKKYPHWDCIVCNAGMTIRKAMVDITNADWESIMQVSVNSHFYLIRDLFHYIPMNSRILFIGSLMGVLPHSTSLAYGVSKAAVHALAKNLVKEFEGTGTTVNVVVPGFVETEWQKNKPIEIRDNIYNKTAIKRFAAVEEIASACMFCIDNAFINGSLIEIDGGYCFK